MRLRDKLVRMLLSSKELTVVEWGVYLTIWHLQPASISQLASIARVSRSTANKGCTALARHGWVDLVTEGYRVRPVARVPVACQELLVAQLEEEYAHAAFKGEFLMKRFLDLAVATDEYVDNARPPFLVNPLTGEPLEYDRYYLLGVAFEFNGPQHLGPTRHYPSSRQQREIEARDLIKKGRSAEAKVTLVTITAELLYPEVMESMLPEQLPRWLIDKAGPYYRALASLCAAYAAKAVLA